MTEAIHGTTSSGQNVGLFTLSNSHGMTATVSELGATLISVIIPGADGNPVELTLGHDSFQDWEENPAYFGAVCGRYGNRIAAGQFSLGDQTYQLHLNNDPGGIPCSLHGGQVGFNRKLWQAKALSDKAVQLRYRSPDGEENYPGTLDVQVTYRLSEDNTLTFEVEATSDAPTPVNIVQHVYWNLADDHSQPITGHELSVAASHFLPTDQGMIPTGERRSVEGTPMDFRHSHQVGARIDDDDESLRIGAGYDHCFVLGEDFSLRSAARLHEPESGRTLEITTDQPGLQVYSGNFLDCCPTAGRNNLTYPRRSGMALEAQNFPNAPNQPDFPNSILHPGKVYRQTTHFQLSWPSSHS